MTDRSMDTCTMTGCGKPAAFTVTLSVPVDVAGPGPSPARAA
ncbi:MAG TPA: hypothetical protein VNL94_01315 [Candidatus Binatia bacterium]|nr:hypothetical protein [Candidatus Binatia bacterium]